MLESPNLILNQDVTLKVIKGIEKKRAKKYKELSQRMDRERSLSKTVSDLEISKKLMGKGKVNKKNENGQTTYKWERVRKK